MELFGFRSAVILIYGSFRSVVSLIVFLHLSSVTMSHLSSLQNDFPYFLSVYNKMHLLVGVSLWLGCTTERDSNLCWFMLS